MLRRSDSGVEMTTAERIVPLDRSRTFITLSVVLYHSVINYTYFGIGGDRMRSALVDLKSPPLWWHTAYGLSFALFCASMTSTVLAFFLRFSKSSIRLLDVMQPSAYGIYLLHFIPLIWLQYFISDPAWPAFVKFAVVFAGTLSLSWAATIALRWIPVVARMI
jgi:surface polysaccharide O-acyltransferase-like enzyme